MALENYAKLTTSNDKFGYEIHITVECTSQEQHDKFEELCSIINAKCIAINLGETNQVMTSKTVYTTFNDLLDTINSDHVAITNGGFNIQRVKLECEPKLIEQYNLDWSYYEIHVPCTLDSDTFDLNTLDRKWHRSRNTFKADTRMLTCRSTNRDEVDLINKDIERMQSLNLVKPDFKHHFEYAIMDTNESLDKGWIK